MCHVFLTSGQDGAVRLTNLNLAELEWDEIHMHLHLLEMGIVLMPYLARSLLIF
jgi:hypothetical protein